MENKIETKEKTLIEQELTMLFDVTLKLESELEEVIKFK